MRDVLIQTSNDEIDTSEEENVQTNKEKKSKFIYLFQKEEKKEGVSKILIYFLILYFKANYYD